LFIIIVGYWAILYKGFRIAYNCQNLFGKYLATGITSLLAFQAIVNMSMTIGLLPVVGMPLLMVSYGGSSLIITMLFMGILVNVGMRRDPFI
jgi:rod shape determining protein RodA